jgi:flagellar L-ring protein precursor FlgH
MRNRIANRQPPHRSWLVALTLLLGGGAGTARAQSSSLFHQDVPPNGAPLSLANSSFLYQPPEPPRVIKINDLITVIVDEKTQVSEQAGIQRRKQYQLNATLADWIALRGLNVSKAPQAAGSPQIDGTLQGQGQAQSNLQTTDGLKLRITARVVDIRPNGHLVLEAHQEMRNNDEIWERSLSGIIRPEDILPNNTVLSEDVAELRIAKTERGQVRDGYRRGWLYYLMDKYGAF